MGLRIFSITLASLLMLGFIDAFINWYGHFLNRKLPFPNMRYLFIRLMWVILCIVFWLHMVFRRLPESFDLSYFLFVAFIYSVKGLIGSFFSRPEASRHGQG